MPEETKDESKKKDGTEDFKASLEAIEKNVTEKIDKKFNEFNHNLDTKLETMKDKTGAGSNEDDENSDVDDDDGLITKKDLKKYSKKIIEDVEKITKKTADEVFEHKTTKMARDDEAVRDFPLLDSRSKEYNESFYREVEAEVKRKMKNGRRSEDPDLIYDAAATVEKRWVNEGKYMPKALADRINQTKNNADDNFTMSKGSNKSNAPNQRQVELAQRFGMTKERLTQHMKKTG